MELKGTNKTNTVGPCYKSENKVEKIKNIVLKVRTRLDQKDNKAYKVIEKATKMNYIYKVVGLGFESGMKVEKKTLIDYQELTKIDESRGMKLNMKKEILNSNDLEKVIMQY
ncbi:hypothetical protein F8M41_009777 [Gigaspora margarita]|uniref:Uncharacterized protein n=1 Tax=Gigaspora margarita TaxID=4874 RepID=A0A8H4A2X3_GIGMA|nr:hypothetical protein F8M41_009777 [Gigaspora margarita]